MEEVEKAVECCEAVVMLDVSSRDILYVKVFSFEFAIRSVAKNCTSR